MYEFKKQLKNTGAHKSGTNGIKFKKLPQSVQIFRGWDQKIII